MSLLSGSITICFPLVCHQVSQILPLPLIFFVFLFFYKLFFLVVPNWLLLCSDSNSSPLFIHYLVSFCLFNFETDIQKYCGKNEGINTHPSGGISNTFFVKKKRKAYPLDKFSICFCIILSVAVMEEDPNVDY